MNTERDQHYAAYRWLLAWMVILVVMAYVNSTRIGHVIIYYALALSLLLVLATQYKFFTWALAPLGTPAQQADTPTSGGGTGGGSFS